MRVAEDSDVVTRLARLVRLGCWSCGPRRRRLVPDTHRSHSEPIPLKYDEVTRQVTKGYLAAAKSWQGCDWTTSFGPRALDLRGLKANQTRLLAEATSGEESDAWTAATGWLEQVERDARDARSAASSAVDLIAKGRWIEAVSRANTACDLEAQYHQLLFWGALRDLIAIAAERSGHAIHVRASDGITVV